MTVQAETAAAVRIEQRFLDGSVFAARYRPAGAPCGTFLASLPLGEERNNVIRTVHLLARRLAARGWDAALFDHPGMGDSAGSGAEMTLAAGIAAGTAVLDWLAPAGACIVLGVRCGAFAAFEIARQQRECRLILWEPHLSGRRYLRELGLREHIRGELAGGAAPKPRLNGRPVSAALAAELEACDIMDRLPASTCLMRIGGAAGGTAVKAQAGGVETVWVAAPPFWNPHEGWDTMPVVTATERVVCGDAP
ncbi:MAG: hypothetical protein ABIF71_11715 [Planctomycetota bacterium]